MSEVCLTALVYSDGNELKLDMLYQSNLQHYHYLNCSDIFGLYS